MSVYITHTNTSKKGRESLNFMITTNIAVYIFSVFAIAVAIAKYSVWRA
jgi:hypothetical protein